MTEKILFELSLESRWLSQTAKQIAGGSNPSVFRNIFSVLDIAGKAPSRKKKLLHFNICGECDFQ